MDNGKDAQDQLAKVPFDPGWNDPPPLRDSSQQITPSKPRNFLNKRVAFPLSGGTNAVPPPAVNLPPVPASMPPIIPPPLQSLPKNPTNEEFSIDNEHTLEEVKQILLVFLEQSSELGSKSADIRRRIDSMDEMWRNGKLNNAIQKQMKELACALRDDQPSKADDIHRALMISHVGVVGTWMPGVKQLVHHCIARSELLNIDKDT